MNNKIDRGLKLVTEEIFESMRPDIVIDAVRAMSARKHRLFACACCRRFWHLIRDPRSREAVRVAELYADKQATKKSLAVAHNNSIAADYELTDRRYEFFWPIYATIYASAWKIRKATQDVSAATAAIFVPSFAGWFMSGESSNEALRNEIRTQIELLKDVFAFPEPIGDRWRTSTVVDLARSIYDDRAFDRMRILADALMDAGCGSSRIIDHCRSDCQHIRGCWVIDLLLSADE